MKVVLSLFVVCLLHGKLISRAQNTLEEIGENIPSKNYCASILWKLWTMTNRSRLLTVPCNKEYRRLDWPDSIEARRNNEYTKNYGAGTEILGSVDNLTHWALKEEMVFDLAQQRMRSLRLEIKVMEEYVEDYTISTEKLLKGANVRFRNPQERAKMVARNGIAAYRMTHRYVDKLHRMKLSVLKDTVNKGLLDFLWATEEAMPLAIRSLNRSSPQETFRKWPSRIDLGYAMQSLIHTQEIYGLDFDSLPRAMALESNNSPQLNAFHCKEIGLYALYKRQFDLAVVWLEEAIKKVMKKSDSSIALASLEACMEIVAYQHNEVHKKMLVDKDKSRGTKNIFTRPVQPFLFIEKETLTEVLMRRIGYKKGWDTSAVNFNYLCSGDEFQTDSEKALLSCWYDWDSHPYWRVGPLKKEKLSLNPPVVQVYEFLGEGDIRGIQEAASKQNGVHTSKIGGKNLLVDRTKARTSVNSWVEHGELPLLEKKIQFLSGLEVEGSQASERLQMVEYTYGRMYLPHPDVVTPLNGDDPEITDELMESMAETGQRVMTVLFYLNNVVAGGSTPFCDGGVSAKPVKGSAIVWENLHRNGSARYDTWHGSCPVLYGSKKIANKWILYNQQFQKFKCSLNQFD